jgi:hypothetical protein
LSSTLQRKFLRANTKWWDFHQIICSEQIVRDKWFISQMNRKHIFCLFWTENQWRPANFLRSVHNDPMMVNRLPGTWDSWLSWRA